MKKTLIIGLVSLLALFGIASAHGVTFGADYDGAISVTGEVAYEAPGAALLFGVAVDPTSLNAEVSVGIETARFSVEGADFSVVLRGHVPVFQNGSVVVGQVEASAGLQVALTGNAGLATPVIEVGARNALTVATFSQMPNIYFRAGLAFDF